MAVGRGVQRVERRRRLKCHLGRRSATAEGSIPSESAGTRRRSASGRQRMSKAGELDAMLVMRSAETDGVFIQARGSGKQVEFARRPLCIRSRLRCQPSERRCESELRGNQRYA